MAADDPVEVEGEAVASLTCTPKPVLVTTLDDPDVVTVVV